MMSFRDADQYDLSTFESHLVESLDPFDDKLTTGEKRNMTTGNEKKKPFFDARAGQVQATVWMNKQTFNGVERDVPSIQIIKQYPKKVGDTEVWTKTDSYSLSDLQKLEVVLAEVQRKLLLSEKQGGPS